ncbi:MAG TPA: hypothetical protein ENN60_02040 [archaeon]|nr:hypothetical protein [archaeon]
METAVGILNQIINDSAVPRNIKGTCKDAVERLKNGNNAPHIRAGSVACILDELSQDPNLPFHTRAQIWEVASVLETVTTSSKVK